MKFFFLETATGRFAGFQGFPPCWNYVNVARFPDRKPMSDSFHEVWFLKYVRFINIGNDLRNLSISMFNGRSCTVARFECGTVTNLHPLWNRQNHGYRVWRILINAKSFWKIAIFNNVTLKRYCFSAEQIDISFSCVWPVIDHEFRRNIFVKVVCGSTRRLPFAVWTGNSRMDPQTTPFMMEVIIYNRTDKWKTVTIICFFTINYRINSCVCPLIDNKN